MNNYGVVTMIMCEIVEISGREQRGTVRESLQVLKFWKIAQNCKYRLVARGLPPSTNAGQ